MRFYKNQHQFYIGIDLHARTMYICVINRDGQTVFHKNMECSRDNLELVTNTFGKDIVIGVECIFTWYWVADFCAENGIDFALGHAYYMKSIHGGKTKAIKSIQRKLQTCFAERVFEKNSVKKNVSFSDECSRSHMLTQKQSVQYAIFSEDGSSLSDSEQSFPCTCRIQIISTI